MANILGIETSCDETAAAVVAEGRLVLANVVASQEDLHTTYGGVVPEIASRAHLEQITPVIQAALEQANLSPDHIDAVAVGNRPGLIGSLIVGVSAAKAWAWALGKPLVGVDHVQAHLYAASLAKMGTGPISTADDACPPSPAYPALGMVVSGGHTSLYHLNSPLDMHVIGRTIDDAVGEAYDKAAIILGLPYPGGPRLDKLAQTGDPTAYKLPRSLLDKGSLDFSFSGLKTAMLYTVRGQPQGRGKSATFERSADDLTDQQRADMAASFQAAAIDTVLIKIQRALDHMAAEGSPAQSLILGGGVSANALLRQRVQQLGIDRDLPVYLPAMPYCLDNAAMIAGLAHHLLEAGQTSDYTLPAIATTSLK